MTDLPGVCSIYYGPRPETSLAAMGQAIRLAGRTLKVLVIWFLKSPDHFGEEFAVEGLKDHLDLFPMHPPMDYNQIPEPEQVQYKVDRGMKLARESWTSREYDLIVLDEILTCCDRGMVPWGDVAELLASRPNYMHATLTGTACPPEVAEFATTLIHFDCARHHLDTMEPRKGFDR